MKSTQYSFSLFVFLFLLFGCGNNSPIAKSDTCKKVTDTTTENHQIAGGACDYDEFAGMARIISVKQFPKNYKGCLEGSEEIKFSYISPDPKSKAHEDSFFRDTAYLQINYWMKPSEQEIKQLNLKVGTEFKCVKRIITKGTCTPVIMNFPNDSLLSAKFCN